MVVIHAEIQQEVHKQVVHLVTLLMQGPITEDIAMQVDSYDDFKTLEIMNGQWVGFESVRDEYMTGEEHGWIESLILAALTMWAIEHSAGRVYPGATSFVLDGIPGHINIRVKPDVAFVQTKRIQKTKKYYFGAPDLAVEITSPSDSADDIQSKIESYLQHGTEQVWQVYPDSKQIIVHLSNGTSKKYGVEDTITGGDLLTGFELEVSKVFES